VSGIHRVEASIERLVSPIAARSHAGPDTSAFVRCRGEAEDGPAGTGRFLAPQGAALLSAGMDEELRAAARDIKALPASVAKRFNPRGGTGVFTAALSAFDMALWDLKACARARPAALVSAQRRKAGGRSSTPPSACPVKTRRCSPSSLSDSLPP
jgi:L-alanine-DL-glutamate epimerase-like enolase superfamily enzyme